MRFEKYELLLIAVQGGLTVRQTTWCKFLEQAAAVAMSASAANDIPKVDVRTMAQELREISAQRRNNENGEAALKAPYHLFFFSAVDLAERSRFFDIMKQEDGFTLAERVPLHLDWVPVLSPSMKLRKQAVSIMSTVITESTAPTQHGRLWSSSPKLIA